MNSGDNTKSEIKTAKKGQNDIDVAPQVDRKSALKVPNKTKKVAGNGSFQRSSLKVKEEELSLLEDDHDEGAENKMDLNEEKEEE